MIVTLSRQLGSGGDAIAARVVAALGLTLIDRGTVYQASLAAGVPADLLQKLMYEGQRSLASELINSWGNLSDGARRATTPSPNPLVGIFAPLLPPAAVSPEEAAQAVGLVIKDLASRGNVLVLGQGGQMWLRGYAGACHVQVVAPLELRIARVAEREKVTPPIARRLVRGSDLARSEYVARYHNVRWQDPLLYHLVVNTGQTPVDAAVSLIVHATQVMGREI